jgi:tetratricopeptide (TPR) repeat protein
MLADSTNRQINLLNAIAYYGMDNYREAIARLEKCHASGDSSVMLNKTLGLSYYLINDYENAELYLNKAFGRDTTDTKMLFALAKTRFFLNHFSEAVDCYNRILSQLIPDEYLLFTIYKGMAESMENSGALDEAVLSYNIALSKTATNSEKMEIYYRLAIINEEKISDLKSAIFYYNRYQSTMQSYHKFMVNKLDCDSLLPEDRALIEKESAEIKTKIDAAEQYITQLTDRMDRQIDAEIKKNPNSIYADSIIKQTIQ